MTPSIPLPREHGGDGTRLAVALGVRPDAVLDLSMSLNPFAPNIEPLLAPHLKALRRYPDPERATDALAHVIGVNSDRLLLTNGGAEAIALIAGMQRVGHVEDPEFSLYRRHLEHEAQDAPRWRSNPNNPTGTLADPTEHAAVWDEAFYPLATGHWSRGDDAFIIGSLTKLFACPGLRIGYVISPHPATAAMLAARQPQWALNALASAALPDMLALADLPAWHRAIRSARSALVDLLARHNLRTEPSEANFVLIRHAPGLRTHLAQRAVLVRDTTTFGIPHGVRIAVPDPSGLSHLAIALKGYR